MIRYSEKPAKWIQRPEPNCGRQKTQVVSRQIVEADDMPVYGRCVILGRIWLWELIRRAGSGNDRGCWGAYIFERRASRGPSPLTWVSRSPPLAGPWENDFIRRAVERLVLETCTVSLQTTIDGLRASGSLQKPLQKTATQLIVT